MGGRCWRRAAALVLAMTGLVAPIARPGHGAVTASASEADASYGTVDAALAAGVVDPEVVDALRDGTGADVLISASANAVEVAVAAAEGATLRRLTRDGERLPIDPVPDASAYRAAIAEQQRASAPETPGVTTLRRFGHLPVVTARIQTEEALLRLLNAPGDRTVRADVGYRRALASSLPLISQPQALANGIDGTGTVIGLIDSGLDYTRGAFGPCTAPGVPTSCKVAEMPPDFASPDLVLDDDLHGTVAGGIIVGVAPGAKLIVADVFAGDVAPSSAVVAAIDHLVARRAAGVNIRAVNLSLGRPNTHYQSPCADRLGLTGLLSWGMLPVVASGNDAHVAGSYVPGVADPACVPGVLSVGAVYSAAQPVRWNWGACTDRFVGQADTPPCFSQDGALLSIYAPGAFITAAGVANAGGTSFAAPHAAGATAILAQARPSLSADQLRLAAIGLGPAQTSPASGLRTRRLDLVGALIVAEEIASSNHVPTQRVRLEPPWSQTMVSRVSLTQGFSPPQAGPPFPPPKRQARRYYEVPMPSGGFLTVGGCQLETAPQGFSLFTSFGAGRDGPVREVRSGPTVNGCPTWRVGPLPPGTESVSVSASVDPWVEPANVGTFGSLIVQRDPPIAPANDDRTSALDLAAHGFAATPLDIAFASLEPGESTVDPGSGRRSVWVRSSTTERRFHVLITGGPPWDGGFGPPPTTSVDVTAFRGSAAVSFRRAPLALYQSVTAGPFEAADAVQIIIPDGEYFTIQVIETRAPLIFDQHDDRSTPVDLFGYQLEARSTTAGATANPGEVIAGAPGVRSLWYRWTVPEAMERVINVQGFGNRVRFSVRRDDVEQCSPITVPLALASNLAQCRLSLTPGTYEIGIDTIGGTYGAFEMWTFEPPPDVGRQPAPAAGGGSTPNRGAAGGGAPATSAPRSPAGVTPLPGTLTR